MLGGKRRGDVFAVEWSLEGMWVKLKDQPGWMLTHGAQVGLGLLVSRRRAHWPRRRSPREEALTGELGRKSRTGSARESQNPAVHLSLSLAGAVRFRCDPTERRGGSVVHA